MSRTIENIYLELDEDLKEKLSLLAPNWSDYRLLRQSVDARRRNRPRWVYSVEIAENGEKLPASEIEITPIQHSFKEKPIIIGSGPAGLFAALRFVERGIPCLLFERGSCAEKRILSITRYWRYGELNPQNNVCFGEGGAGLYSDGKLITRIKSSHIPYVMNRLVQFGAPAEIQYLANPHVGSDRIRRLIPVLRNYLINHGCEIHFDTQVTELLSENQQIIGVKTNHGKTFHSHFVILATGHSASDVFSHLQTIGVSMSGKSFAVGLRVEHPQKYINKIQYHTDNGIPELGAANYRLAHHDHQSGIGVYSFCMCPGGYVLSSATESDGIVCNGMSNYRRSSTFANAAIVVSVDHEKNFGTHQFAGLDFRRQIEKAAFASVIRKGGTKELPAQRLVDFLNQKDTEKLQPSSSLSGSLAVRLDEILPNFISKKLREGFNAFDSRMHGFICNEAQLFGVETRTSCPIRIDRNSETFESLSHRGLFPAGEGAGYAGGITSAACDGVRVAESIAAQLSHQTITIDQ